jgi:DNA-binding transcriptional regulator YiaG
MCDLVNGPPPSEDYHAAHNCGKGHEGCVHPDHIDWKTVGDNLLDRRKHGTHEGGKGSRAMLSAGQIAEIRSLNGVINQYEIAKQFGVSRGCIQYWFKDDEPPAGPGMSPMSVWRRKNNISRARVR